MNFAVNKRLLAESRDALAGLDRLYWVVGGAGSGKTTICRALQQRYGLPVYDMDAHIYGTYHQRFVPERHPANMAWSTAPDGLAWLLAMTWQEFDSFNQAALPEYLDLLAEDLRTIDADAGLLIDGGICNPALLTQVLPPCQIVCLALPGRSSAEIWSSTDERVAMKTLIDRLPNSVQAWQQFLAFDTRITQTILRECQDSNIAVCSRRESESVDALAERVAHRLQIHQDDPPGCSH